MPRGLIYQKGLFPTFKHFILFPVKSASMARPSTLSSCRFLPLTVNSVDKDDELERLRIILGLSPRLEIAYDLKNDFLEFMHSPDSQTAKERLKLWLMHAENYNLPEFNACTKAMRNWAERNLHCKKKFAIKVFMTNFSVLYSE